MVEYIAAPVSRVYALSSCKPSRIPIKRDGSALIARKSDLDEWVRDGGGKDIFVSASALNRAGISELAEGQRVAVDMVEGSKGPEAVSLRLI